MIIYYDMEFQVNDKRQACVKIIDGTPSLDVYDFTYRVKKKGHIDVYIGRHESLPGILMILIHNPRDERGHAGKTFILKVKGATDEEPTQRTVKGVWSSNARAVNELLETTHFIDAVVSVNGKSHHLCVGPNAPFWSDLQLQLCNILKGQLV